METPKDLDREEILKSVGAAVKAFGNQWMLVTKSGTGIILGTQIRSVALRIAHERMFGKE